MNKDTRKVDITWILFLFSPSQMTVLFCVPFIRSFLFFANISCFDYFTLSSLCVALLDRRDCFFCIFTFSFDIEEWITTNGRRNRWSYLVKYEAKETLRRNWGLQMCIASTVAMVTNKWDGLFSVCVHVCGYDASSSLRSLVIRIWMTRQPPQPNPTLFWLICHRVTIFGCRLNQLQRGSREEMYENR